MTLNLTKNQIIMMIVVVAIVIALCFLFFKKNMTIAGPTVKIITPPAGTPLPAGESNFSISMVSNKDLVDSVSNKGWLPFGY